MSVELHACASDPSTPERVEPRLAHRTASGRRSGSCGRRSRRRRLGHRPNSARAARSASRCRPSWTTRCRRHCEFNSQRRASMPITVRAPVSAIAAQHRARCATETAPTDRTKSRCREIGPQCARSVVLPAAQRGRRLVERDQRRRVVDELPTVSGVWSARSRISNRFVVEHREQGVRPTVTATTASRLRIGFRARRGVRGLAERSAAARRSGR